MPRSKLVQLKIRNIGCIGPEGLEVALDNIVCLVGRNNTGKSTVIRGYELAQGAASFQETDRCLWTPEGDFPEIELDVHIPDGTPNVDDKWKQDQDGLRIVRSRWRWVDGAKTRQTWDPELNDGAGDWAEDGKAAGADNVFNSRLPKPLRVDALDDAFEEHDELLKLVTEPAVRALKKLQGDQDSPLRRALDQYVAAAMEPVNEYQETVNRIGTQVHEGFRGVFPELNIHIKVGMEAPNVDAAKALLAGSSIRFQEGGMDTGIRQQGTGSRRALFWTLLQVRNGIEREKKIAQDRQKLLTTLNKELEREKAKKKQDDQKIEGIVKQIQAVEQNPAEDDDENALPGYILLIDEPENCLHPMAVRAARAHLYALAEDSNWQVMLSTHSPFFIDPLADHTSIVRLDRTDRQTSPKTFRTSTAGFSEEEKENLRALLQLDNALTEMFFGSYPIVVEGDTEAASFIAAILEEQHDLSTKVALVPARGKALIAPIVKLLTHFRISFGVLHDTDSPRIANSNRNGAWTENEKILDAIQAARQKGLAVRHRVSVPDFERRFGGEEGNKDKPLLAFRKTNEDANIKKSVQILFTELFEGANLHPVATLDTNATREQVSEAIKTVVREWAQTNAPTDPRFAF